MLALEHRRRIGEGMLLEVPQVRSALNVTAEQVIEHHVNGVVLERVGNRSWSIAPQGAYRVLDVPRSRYPNDDWIAISVATEEQWQSLCRVLRAHDLAADPALATVAGRLADQDRIDERIAGWARPPLGSAAVATLLAAGVPAAQMAVLHERADVDVVVARQLYEVVDQPGVGELRIIGFPVRIESGPSRWHRAPAPTLGQHNGQILMGLLGRTADEVTKLEADGVVGTRAEVNIGW